MITPNEADHLSELVLTAYCRSCECQTAEDVRKACEKMISKASRAVEKYNSTAVALEVLNRTVLHISPAGGQG